jgi:signal transduction histidine kinase
MKGRIVFVSILFSSIIMLCSGILYIKNSGNNTDDIRRQQIVAVNELEQLAKIGDIGKLTEKSAILQKNLLSSGSIVPGCRNSLVLGLACVIYIIIVFGYIYFWILMPFNKMKIFAKEIAQGNFEIPLRYERSNYFGDFTWAFDSMRNEIKKARSCEKEAVENNKTIIATLSHDIKTPIASIRAYAEGLEANMDNSVLKRQKYISVIMKKCDEVSRLTNDLFLHSVSDLDKLKISLSQFELCEFLNETLTGLSDGQEDIRLLLPDKKILVSADKNRLAQVCGNLINNARKYAKTEIDISVILETENVKILFRDYGKGIPDSDMPFIFNKFYRGRNCGSEQGSGLGLYIVDYIVKRMDGKVVLNSYKDGLEAVIVLPVISVNCI